MSIRVLIAGCLGLASPLLWAGSLPVPVDGKVVDQRPAVEQERIYPMGPLRKISGRLRVDDKVESRGQVSSVTYELPGLPGGGGRWHAGAPRRVAAAATL